MQGSGSGRSLGPSLLPVARFGHLFNFQLKRANTESTMHTHNAHTHTLRHTLMHTYAYAQQVKSDRQALSSLTSRHDMLLLLFLLLVSLLLLLDNCFRATEREGEGGRTGTGR